MIRHSANKHRPICNQLLELDHLYSRVDIDTLHFDFQRCKSHFHRMMIYRTHCSTCALSGCIIVLAGNRYCRRMERSGNQESYCMDRRCMVPLDIDIWLCDCLRHKLRADHSEHLHKLVDIPMLPFDRSFCISHFQNIRH